MKYYHTNNRITASKIRLIDENDNHIGIIETNKAINMAREKGLDLVEISPKADPPIAKLLNFGQFKYDIKKKEKKHKKQAKISDIKGVRLTPRISKHDLSFRVDNSKKFLKQGRKVKIEMILRGRERAHYNLAYKLINQFIELLGDEIKIEQKAKKQGNRIISIVSLNKQTQTENVKNQ